MTAWLLALTVAHAVDAPPVTGRSPTDCLPPSLVPPWVADLMTDPPFFIEEGSVLYGRQAVVSDALWILPGDPAAPERVGPFLAAPHRAVPGVGRDGTVGGQPLTRWLDGHRLERRDPFVPFALAQRADGPRPRPVVDP